MLYITGWIVSPKKDRSARPQDVKASKVQNKRHDWYTAFDYSYQDVSSISSLVFGDTIVLNCGDLAEILSHQEHFIHSSCTKEREKEDGDHRPGNDTLPLLCSVTGMILDTEEEEKLFPLPSQVPCLGPCKLDYKRQWASGKQTVC